MTTPAAPSPYGLSPGVHVSYWVLAGLTSTSTFIALLPSPTDLREADPTQADRYRTAEKAAVAISLGVGLALSVAADGPQPFTAALVASGILVLGTEYLLRAAPPRTT